jgi:hypothetical protein
MRSWRAGGTSRVVRAMSALGICSKCLTKKPREKPHSRLQSSSMWQFPSKVKTVWCEEPSYLLAKPFKSGQITKILVEKVARICPTLPLRLYQYLPVTHYGKHTIRSIATIHEFIHAARCC